MIDSNQNDKISIIELNKFSKDGGMVAGLNKWLKDCESETHVGCTLLHAPTLLTMAVSMPPDNVEKAVILDDRARKFWKKYFEKKKTDFDYFWECLCQEWGEKLDEYDLLKIEKMVMKELPKLSKFERGMEHLPSKDSHG